MDIPRISVIIPVYNAGAYLNNTINSVLRQTINTNEVESILVNDGSSDNSLEVCKVFAVKHSNIRLYCHDDCGASSARN